MFAGLFVHGYSPCTGVMQLESSPPIAFPMEGLVSQLVDEMHQWSTVGTLDFTMWLNILLFRAGRVITRFDDIQEVAVESDPDKCPDHCDGSACFGLEAASETQTSILSGGIYETRDTIRTYTHALPLGSRWHFGSILAPNASHWNGKVFQNSSCDLICSVLHLHDMQRAPHEAFTGVVSSRRSTMLQCIRNAHLDVLRTALRYAQDLEILAPLIRDVLASKSFMNMANTEDVVGLRLPGCTHNSPYPYQYVNPVFGKNFSVDRLDHDCVLRHFLSAMNGPENNAPSSTFDLSTILDNSLVDQNQDGAMYPNETEEIMANWTGMQHSQSEAAQTCSNDDAKWQYY